MGRLNIKGIEQVAQVVDAVRSACDENMVSQHLAAFLYIVKNNGCSVADLAKYMDTSQASVSRATTALSNVKQPGKKPGYGLIKAEEDPYDRRRKLLVLTKKGKDVVEKVNAILATD